jgi:hypothetical protein
MGLIEIAEHVVCDTVHLRSHHLALDGDATPIRSGATTTRNGPFRRPLRSCDTKACSRGVPSHDRVNASTVGVLDFSAMPRSGGREGFLSSSVRSRQA